MPKSSIFMTWSHLEWYCPAKCPEIHQWTFRLTELPSGLDRLHLTLCRGEHLDVSFTSFRIAELAGFTVTLWPTLPKKVILTYNKPILSSKWSAHVSYFIINDILVYFYDIQSSFHITNHMYMDSLWTQLSYDTKKSDWLSTAHFCNGYDI